MCRSRRRLAYVYSCPMTDSSNLYVPLLSFKRVATSTISSATASILSRFVGTSYFMYSNLLTSIYNTRYHSYGFYYRLRSNKSRSISNCFCIPDVVIHACYSIHSSAPPPKVDISPPGGTPTAGETSSLTCSVTLDVGMVATR